MYKRQRGFAMRLNRATQRRSTTSDCHIITATAYPRIMQKRRFGGVRLQNKERKQRSTTLRICCTKKVKTCRSTTRKLLSGIARRRSRVMQKRIQPLDVWATRQWRNKMFSNLNCNSRSEERGVGQECTSR